MSTYSAPNEVTNGLVFYYDMSNTHKSWKGPPVTNLLNYSDSLNGEPWTGYCGDTSNVTYKTTDIVAPDGSYNATKLVMSGSITCGSGPCWGLLSGYSLRFISGQTYTVSIWARCATGTLSMQLGMNDSFGTTVILTTTWQRFSYTAIITSNLDRGLQFIRGDATNGITFYVWGAQCEQNTFASHYMSSSTGLGTRQNTQAIIDLTGNNTITATSLTYNSDGSFSFDGVSNSLTVPFNSSLFTFDDEQTVIIWMKNQSPSADRRNPYNMAYAGAGSITHESDTQLNYYYGTEGGDSPGYANHASPFSVVLGETAMICITRNTSQTAWYKNGILYNTKINPYGTVVTGTNDITIGAGYAGHFGGNLYVVQVYNRALSAGEVLQNFSSLRGRFGK